MFAKPINFLRRAVGFESLTLHDLILMGLARGQAGAQCRILDPANPNSWEFSGFSQNGEDGLIDYLTRKMRTHNSYFVEIGAGTGMENNTTWLAFGRKWAGLMIDGDENNIKACRKLTAKTQRVDCLTSFVNLDNILHLQQTFKTPEPDVFSLDIDGNDYHIMKKLLDNDLRPGIVIVEFNSVLGPQQARAIKYDKDFRYQLPLNFGTSIRAWQHLFPPYGYRFVTVDTSGTNAFFVNEALFDREFLDNIKGLGFAENLYLKRIYKSGWEEQIKLIKDELFINIEA
jgi:hypothetical protein